MEQQARATIGHRASDQVVSIILLCANQLSYTRQCIESIIRHTHSPYELIIVDNASNDETPSYLASLTERPGPKRVCVLRNGVNRGFSCGCNQGFAAAQGEFVLFLNNDTIVSVGWLDGLYKLFTASCHE